MAEKKSMKRLEISLSDKGLPEVQLGEEKLLAPLTEIDSQGKLKRISFEVPELSEETIKAELAPGVNATLSLTASMTSSATASACSCKLGGDFKDVVAQQ